MSCKNEPQSPASRDLLMDNYLKTVDSFPRFDSLTEDFKLLKAYHKNDTSYLRRAYNELTRTLRTWDDWSPDTTCQTPTPIHLLDFDKAYRFGYGASFCDTAMIMTIGKRKAEVVAQIILYRFDIFTDKCMTVKRIEKKLDLSTWEKLSAGIQYSDFWGLRADNGMEGCDGSALHVFAFERPVNAFRGRYKAIYRWSAERTAIGAVFKDMIDATGVEVSCFHYYDPE